MIRWLEWWTFLLTHSQDPTITHFIGQSSNLVPCRSLPLFLACVLPRDQFIPNSETPFLANRVGFYQDLLPQRLWALNTSGSHLCRLGPAPYFPWLLLSPPALLLHNPTTIMTPHIVKPQTSIKRKHVVLLSFYWRLSAVKVCGFCLRAMPSYSGNSNLFLRNDLCVYVCGSPMIFYF